jgi:hypothetical protein
VFWCINDHIEASVGVAPAPGLAGYGALLLKKLRCCPIDVTIIVRLMASLDSIIDNE